MVGSILELGGYVSQLSVWWDLDSSIAGLKVRLEKWETGRRRA